MRKNRASGVFEADPHDPRSTSQAAVGRHDHLHRHVEARGRGRRHQPVAGLPGFRLRSGARRRRRAAHAQRAEPVRADAGRAAAAPGDRGEVRRAYHGGRYDPETEVTVTSGGTEAIFDAVAAVVQPGDEVIVLEPCYDSYVPAIELSGGTPVFVAAARSPTTRSTGTRCGAAITPRTRMIMLNSPHNPAGAVLDAGDIARAGGARRAAPASSILSDEVYEHIIFDGRAAREHGAPRRARRAQLRRRIVRQDLSHHRLEGRLRGGAGGADRRVPQGAPVRHVLDQHAGAARDRRLPRDRGAGSPSCRRSSRPSATCSCG